MADDRQERLDDLLARRDKLRDKVQRVTGRLDSARQELKTVDDECVQRKVPPDQLEEALRRLGGKFDIAVAELETNIESSETAIAPFLKEDCA
jgi:predicted nuclease with TOPRIM domain